MKEGAIAILPPIRSAWSCPARAAPSIRPGRERETHAAPSPEGSAGISAVEVDSVGKNLMLRLPVPIGVLTYREATTSDHPEHKTGTTNESIRFRRK
jgi:hypothetical protein